MADSNSVRPIRSPARSDGPRQGSSPARPARTGEKPGTPVWQPVVQVMLPTRQHGPENRERMRAAVLDWAGNSRRWRGGWREHIPESAYAGAPFEAMEDDCHLQVTKTADKKVWSFHVEHPEQSARPRRWKLEAFVADRDTHDEVGVRVFCLAPAGEFIHSNSPVIVKSFVQSGQLLDAGFDIRDTPIPADDDDSYERFTDLILAPARRLPVVVLSQLASRTEDAKYAVDPALLARSFQGVAHVVGLPANQCQWLSDELGRDLGVFRGAVRVYMPGFNAHADRRDHPLYLAERIVMDKSQKSFDKLLGRRIRGSTVDTSEKLSAWPQADAVAAKSGLNLFEGLRRALGLFKRNQA